MNLDTKSFKLIVYLQGIGALLCLAALCSVPVTMFIDGISEYRQWRYLLENGGETQGIILSVEPDPGKGLRGVIYQYEAQTENGGGVRSYRASKDVTGSFAASIRIGQSIPVLYDPDQPRISRLKEDRQFWWELMFIPTILLLCVLSYILRCLISKVQN
jgi:hypothetical protein